MIVIMNNNKEQTLHNHKVELANAYISLAYTLIHVYFSTYAFIMNFITGDIQSEYIYYGFIASALYYTYSTIEVYYHFKLNMTKMMSLIHHAITLLILYVVYNDPTDDEVFVINIAFMLAMISNIEIFAVYIKEKHIDIYCCQHDVRKNTIPTKLYMYMLLSEAIMYTLFRVLCGTILMIYILSNDVLNVFVFRLFMVIYLVSILWAYKLCRNVKWKYIKYKLYHTKKTE